MGMNSRAKTTHALEGAMLIQEKINTPDTLLKLYIASDEDLKALQPQLQAKQFSRDPHGGTPVLSAAGSQPRCLAILIGIDQNST